MKNALKRNLRHALRLFELAVAIALLAVLTELVLIQLNTPHGDWESTRTRNPVANGANPAPQPTQVEKAAPLQMAAKPAQPPAAVAPPVPPRAAPVPPQRTAAPPAPSNPPPLLSFHYLRQEVRSFVHFVPFFILGEPASSRPRDPGVAETNAPASAANQAPSTNTAPGIAAQASSNSIVARTGGPAGSTNGQPGPSTIASAPPDLRNTNGMFRLAIP